MLVICFRIRISKKRAAPAKVAKRTALELEHTLVGLSMHVDSPSPAKRTHTHGRGNCVSVRVHESQFGAQVVRLLASTKLIEEQQQQHVGAIWLSNLLKDMLRMYETVVSFRDQSNKPYAWIYNRIAFFVHLNVVSGAACETTDFAIV